MPRSRSLAVIKLPGLALILVALTAPSLAGAHGFAGKRFFPATLSFDDPFAQDEFDVLFNTMPNVNEDGDSIDINSLSVEYAKSITPGIALSVGTAYNRLKFADDSSEHGFDNIELSGKFMGRVDEQSESVWSYGLDIDLGGTGSHGIGEDFTVYSPSFYFGKGLGNAFDNASYLRPLAFTGKIAVALPDQGDQPRSLDTAFSVQYSLTYLESFVKDVGLPQALRNALLLVELPLQTCLDQGCDGDMTGTINPGIIFFNKSGQLSVEAVIPANDRTGDSVGALFQLHLYLDDLFPHTLGKPIFP